MIFVTSKEVENRRNRGYEEINIYAPCDQRLEEAAEIAKLVTKAFSNVELGPGIGLFEGQAIDNYESDSGRRDAREKDEKKDWRRIQSKHLNACHSSLSFFDSMGMRFHLPAFICCELKGEYHQGLEISLSGIDDWKIDKLSRLSTDQKGSIATFIQFLMEDADSEFSRPLMEADLIKYWLVN